MEAIRLGRFTAFPDGSKGFVVGDAIRRLVARTLGKHISKRVETTTALFKHASKTKIACGVGHVLQTFTDLDPEATVCFFSRTNTSGENSVKRNRHHSRGP